MDIYIKPKKKISVVGKKVVHLKDVGELFISGNMNQDLGNMVVMTIEMDQKKNYLLSVMDIIRSIHNKLPDATVVNVGEMDVVVEYLPKSAKPNQLFMILKIFCICIILFVGAATAIMSFHSDAQMPQIFRNFYYIFFKQQIDTPYIIAIPYSIGLAVGIIVFFNHFAKFYITTDPTPIEVQMTTYESETIKSVIDNLEKSKEKGGGS